MLIADARRVSRASSKMKDETGVGECREERSKSTEDAGEGEYGGVGYVDGRLSLSFLRRSEHGQGDVGSRRAVGKERLF